MACLCIVDRIWNQWLMSTHQHSVSTQQAASSKLTSINVAVTLPFHLSFVEVDILEYLHFPSRNENNDGFGAQQGSAD